VPPPHQGGQQWSDRFNALCRGNWTGAAAGGGAEDDTRGPLQFDRPSLVTPIARFVTMSQTGFSNRTLDNV